MGWKLHVERWGQAGPAVLLVHGIGGSGRNWRLVAEALAGEARIFAPDLLGFGRSPWPEIDYRVDEHLDALDDTLDALGSEVEGTGVRALLAGHSLGAIMALAWAARHPDRFGGVVLFGLPCYRSPEEARRHVAGLGPLAYATVARPRLGAAICGVMCFGRPFWRRVAPLLLHGVPPDIARDGVLHTWRSYSRTLNHVILDLDTGALADRVAATDRPVRLLHGDRDRQAPPDCVAELARRTGWPLDLVAGADHGLPLEQPSRCADAIRALLPHGRPATGESRRCRAAPREPSGHRVHLVPRHVKPTGLSHLSTADAGSGRLGPTPPPLTPAQGAPCGRRWICAPSPSGQS